MGMTVNCLGVALTGNLDLDSRPDGFLSAVQECMKSSVEALDAQQAMSYEHTWTVGDGYALLGVTTHASAAEGTDQPKIKMSSPAARSECHGTIEEVYFSQSA
ncbi:hypothetical protein PGT21_035125 [Puccinia graminis f. sp. tritici]|uniref:Uncharacterized protein n=1 Tax=Puccinia graminis f. sp. tritici TaxID=56615 RepID=A0A5B0N668_PUCGR|nr:hypothetical protein PGTUg99_023467 [Puccinia graminis f. sp. tritici]KAA1084757.1 hypothetical protein PGT21_035125 [Puccinia graminis f. sp. tritici]